MQTPNPPELILLKALWANGTMAVRPLHEICAHKLNWSLSSTRKTLERMVDKGYVERISSNGTMKIRPRVSKTTTLARLVRNFYKHTFEIEGAISVDGFSDSPLLDDEELAEIAGLLG